jgi:vancomycin permeability regulator SanA
MKRFMKTLNETKRAFYYNLLFTIDQVKIYTSINKMATQFIRATLQHHQLLLDYEQYNTLDAIVTQLK